MGGQSLRLGNGTSMTIGGGLCLLVAIAAAEVWQLSSPHVRYGIAFAEWMQAFALFAGYLLWLEIDQITKRRATALRSSLIGGGIGVFLSLGTVMGAASLLFLRAS